jgi:hypothetical protein
MFKINDDKSIYLTRGDACTIDLTANNGGEPYTFVKGDLVRLKVTEKKNCRNVMMAKDVRVDADTNVVSIALSGEETKFGEVISKPTDYWYEVELNPDVQPQTIIGYDENGGKTFRLYPEGGGET